MSHYGKHEVSFSGAMSRDKVVAYLEGLIEGLKAGKVCVEKASEFLTVHPEENIYLGVKAKTKGTKETLSFELKWEKPIEREEEALDLKISSIEPEIVKEEYVEEEEEELEEIPT